MIVKRGQTVKIKLDPESEDKSSSKLAEYFRSELKKRQEVWLKFQKRFQQLSKSWKASTDRQDFHSQNYVIEKQKTKQDELSTNLIRRPLKSTWRNIMTSWWPKHLNPSGFSLEQRNSIEVNERIRQLEEVVLKIKESKKKWQ